MRKAEWLRAVFIGFIFIWGCASASKINGVQLGMTKAEVVSVMGQPVSISAQGKAEYLNYSLRESYEVGSLKMPYYVRLVDGKVESFGRTGDFNSTQVPTVRIENDQTIKKEVKVEGSGDLYTELKKLQELKDSGVLTEEEFQTQKKKIIDKH
jgi:hypothetical protein